MFSCWSDVPKREDGGPTAHVWQTVGRQVEDMKIKNGLSVIHWTFKCLPQQPYMSPVGPLINQVFYGLLNLLIKTYSGLLGLEWLFVVVGCGPSVQWVIRCPHADHLGLYSFKDPSAGDNRLSAVKWAIWKAHTGNIMNSSELSSVGAKTDWAEASCGLSDVHIEPNLLSQVWNYKQLSANGELRCVHGETYGLCWEGIMSQRCLWSLYRQ